MQVQIDHELYETHRTVIEDRDLLYLIERSVGSVGVEFLTVIVFRDAKPIDSHSHQIDAPGRKEPSPDPSVFACAMCPTCLRKFRIAPPLRDVVEAPRCCDRELILIRAS